jgi:hypothetical protein
VISGVTGAATYNVLIYIKNTTVTAMAALMLYSWMSRVSPHEGREPLTLNEMTSPLS